jgi:8-oxo-dGTP pyrophosphatase MutT (NUDIX family)
MKNPWTKIGEKEVYKNKWIRVSEDKVIHPNGQEGIYGRVHCVDSVLIIAETEDNKIIFIKEFKYLIDNEIWNLIAGTVEEGDDVITTAKRELKEEAGGEAKSFEQIGTFYVAPGHEDTVIHVVYAKGTTLSTSNPAGDEAISKVETFSKDEICAMIANGEITIGLALAALNMYWNKK